MRKFIQIVEAASRGCPRATYDIDDDVHKSKNPADIRTDAPSMYPAAQWRP